MHSNSREIDLRTLAGQHKVPLREFQLFQLSIVREFIRICEENDLRYWAAYGTLLGTARHGGFIPWDDDIDFLMPVPDYFVFREVCKRELGEQYYLQVHSENPKNFIGWQRIGVKNSTSMPISHADLHAEWGVCIDIFPLSACPDPKSAEFNQHLKLLKKFNRATKKYAYSHDAKVLTGHLKLYHLLMAFLERGSDQGNINRWLKLEDLLLNYLPLGDSEYCFGMACPHGVFKTEWFSVTEYLPFEDIVLPVPYKYHEVLNSVYGDDWAEVPPEEKRVAHSGGGSDNFIVSLTEPYEQFLI